MIITQTPLRVSLLGGGSDFQQFYSQHEGCVVTTAIDKYIYVIIKKRFDDKIRVGWTRTEMVDDISDIQHDLVRTSLYRTGIQKQIEISTMADIPTEGSGLGSSSTVTVGLLNAMYNYLGNPKDHDTLAEQACHVEIDDLGSPIGRQDQYIAAYGGQRVIRFGPQGVTVETLALSEGCRRALNQNLLLFYTNMTRQANVVLSEQRQNIQDRMEILCAIRDLAYEAQACLQNDEPDHLGRLLSQNWMLKKQLANKISNPVIDDLYQTAVNAGALGGKISGAGGGGFLTLYCPIEKQESVRSALHGLYELPFSLADGGTKVVFQQTR